MAQHYKRRKKYRLKPLPIILAFLLLVTIGVLVFTTIKKSNKGVQIPPTSNDSSDVINANNSVFSDLPSSSSSNSNDLETASYLAVSDLPSNLPSNSSDLETSSYLAVSDLPSNLPSNSSDSETSSYVSVAFIADILICLGPTSEPLKTDLTFDKTKFDSQLVDSRAAPSYTDMYNAAKAEGITLFLRSGYRSMSEQKANYNAEVQRNMNNGSSKEEAIKLTERFYTKPGHSEHHTGLAFDIITPEYHKDVYTLNRQFADTEAYEWLVKNCATYGFILRYPEDKTDITGINYEPWHYRYVGVEVAQYIMSNGICFEEYLDQIN